MQTTSTEDRFVPEWPSKKDSGPQKTSFGSSAQTFDRKSGPDRFRGAGLGGKGSSVASPGRGSPDQETLDSLRVTDREGSQVVLLDAPCPSPVSLQAHRVNESTGEMSRDLEGDIEKPCGRWACQVCGPAKVRRYVAHFTEEFSGLPGVYFATLTLDPKVGVSASVSRKYVQHCWSKWRKRLNRLSRKRGGDGLRYMRVIEYQSNGQAHVHSIMSIANLTEDEIAAAWFESGGGVVCDIQHMDGDRDEIARHVGYAVKYALKDALSEDSVRGRHYVETSEGIGYGSAAAIARRLEYVEQKQREGGESDDLGDHEHRVWTGGMPPSAAAERPDTITDDDLLAFKELNLDRRSNRYRVQDSDGAWWEIRQQEDGSRVRTRLDHYRSLYERRISRAQRSRTPT